jgi:hypothetical protein
VKNDWLNQHTQFNHFYPEAGIPSVIQGLIDWYAVSSVCECQEVGECDRMLTAQPPEAKRGNINPR